MDRDSRYQSGGNRHRGGGDPPRRGRPPKNADANGPKPYPLDVHALQPGDRVAVEQIKSSMSPKGDENEVKKAPYGYIILANRYNLAKLALCEFIMKQRTDLLAKGDGMEIDILSAKQAVPYVEKRVRNAVRALGRVAELHTRVDREQLDEGERRRLELSERKAGLVYQFGKRACARRVLTDETVEAVKRKLRKSGKKRKGGGGGGKAEK